MTAIVDDKNPYPNETWTLKDWFNATGVHADNDIVEAAVRLGLSDPDEPWNAKRINEAKNGTKTRPQGLLSRNIALDYMVVLKSIAARNGIDLFTPQRIETDSEIFLRSQACRDKYAPLDNAELRHIIEVVTQDRQQTEASQGEPIYALRSRVHPPPPKELFGRETDLRAVLSSLQSNPITVIDGIAGDGKTSLAWISAITGHQHRLYTNFDWVTDKRHVLSLSGDLLLITERENDITFFDNLLVSFCRQFGWQDIIGARGTRLINKCADRLREGRYLLVVDNFETVEDSETIIRQLADMLIPLSVLEPLSSRALITSRVKVAHPNATAVPIHGIEINACYRFIQHLQDIWKIQPRLAQSQIDSLAHITGGNPLLIQLALRRYRLFSTAASFDSLVADLRQGKDNAFVTLFSTLVDQFSSDVLAFAKAIALELVLSQTPTEHNDLWYVWTSLFGEASQVNFLATLEELLNHRIVSCEGQITRTYSMHALILTYFLGL